ncbi:MAG: hypothetical protein ACMUJM_24475 [bacterium]
MVNNLGNGDQFGDSIIHEGNNENYLQEINGFLEAYIDKMLISDI